MSNIFPIFREGIFNRFSDTRDESNSIQMDEGKVDRVNKEAVAKQAENWYNSVTDERSKRKMMKNYMVGVSDVNPQEAEELVEKSISGTTDNAIAQQAESWYESVCSSEKREEMMIEYLTGVFDINRAEAERIIEDSSI